MKVKDKEIPKISNNGLPPLSLTKRTISSNKWKKKK